MNDKANHNKATHRFIELANQMKEEGLEVKLISAALMVASGIYATYSVAGNQGGLQPSGVDKVADMYRKNLEYIQERKRAEAKAPKVDEAKH